VWWLSNCQRWDHIFARVKIIRKNEVVSAPDVHFATRSRLPCELSGIGRVGGARGSQLSVLGLYLPPVFTDAADVLSARRSFRFRSTLPCDLPRAGALARWWLSRYRQHTEGPRQRSLKDVGQSFVSGCDRNAMLPLIEQTRSALSCLAPTNR